MNTEGPDTKAAIAKFAGHASWAILLVGLLVSVAVCKSFGGEWGHGLIATDKVFLTFSFIAWGLAIVFISTRFSSLGLLSTLLSTVALIPMLIIFVIWFVK